MRNNNHNIPVFLQSILCVCVGGGGIGGELLLFIDLSEQRLGNGCGVRMGNAEIISGWWVFN